MEEEDVPDRETCETRINEFTLITKSNSAVAQQFLQESNWSLEQAVPAFFDALAKEEQVDEEPDVAIVEELFGEGKTVTNQPPPRLQLLSWNIDGLDDRSLKRRMGAVVALVRRVEPDVIFFQEVIDEVADYLERKLPEYKAIRANTQGYYTMILLRIFTIKYDSHIVEDFKNSTMGRNLLLCRAHVGQRQFVFINSHLESGRDYSDERQRQLRAAFSKAQSFPSEVTVIVGGDLNMRDSEARDVPASFVDAWEVCGSKPETRWTWDTQRNTNLGIGGGFGGKKGPRLRFDRIYAHLEPRRVRIKDFGLVGAQRAPQTQMFPSDHWGLLVYLELLH